MAENGSKGYQYENQKRFKAGSPAPMRLGLLILLFNKPLIKERIDTDDLLRYTVLALAVIIGSSFLTWNSVLSCVRGIMTVRQLEEQIHEFSNQIKSKKFELNRFKDDFYVENLARRELGLTRPNETEYRFTETETETE